jgi:hypothetical protein
MSLRVAQLWLGSSELDIREVASSMKAGRRSSGVSRLWTAVLQATAEEVADHNGGVRGEVVAGGAGR